MKTHHSIKSKRRFLLGSLALCLIALSTAPRAQAAIIWSENFETTAVGSLPAGWNATTKFPNPDNPKPVVDLSKTMFMDAASGGSYSYSYEPMFSTSSIDFASYAGQTITLSFDFKNFGSLVPDTPLILGLRDAGAGVFDVSAWVAGQGVGAPAENTIYGANWWTHVTIDLTASLAAHPNTDGFVMKLWAGRGANSAANLDNFVVTAVPEPSTAALLLLAGGAAFLRRRRERSKVGKQ